MRTIDKSKKSNLKCEHCKNYKSGIQENGTRTLTNDEKKYWNRCKDFQWSGRLNYKTGGGKE